MREPAGDDKGFFRGAAAGVCIAAGAWSLGHNLREVGAGTDEVLQDEADSTGKGLHR